MAIDTTRMRILLPRIVSAAFLAALLVYGFLRWTAPPQMGADSETFATVDALFTAVTARDEKLLSACEQRLRSLDSAGKMEGSSGNYLDGIVRTAHAGNWDAAARRLYAFMREQRREGDRTQKKDDRRARK